ncbi:MAG: hypothetical protein BGP06_13075 [Rhizobiales bacterium 65-9]|nr:hypothetical protein [Hyphomicrobiales bacterium]OJY39338.1 MAG: hypothetical protein BGP06_13075 [Rhizobiales bacterium 65-9]
MQDRYCHTSSIKVDRPAETAFEIMSNGLKQGAWTWGSFNRSEVQPGIFLGHSVFSGKALYSRLHVDRERLVVDYEGGPTPETMQFRNMSRVLPGATLKLDPGCCVITLLTWRLQTQTEDDWLQISTVHEAEMFLIKGLLERA